MDIPRYYFDKLSKEQSRVFSTADKNELNVYTEQSNITAPVSDCNVDASLVKNTLPSENKTIKFKPNKKGF